MLLTYNQQQLIKPISANNARIYDQLAKEVEYNELIDLLGLPFLQDLQDNPATVNNLLVLDGGSYINTAGTTVKYKGLRFTIAYLNFEKYLDNSDVADTFTGMVQKARQETTSLPEGRLLRLKKNARQIALKEFENLKCFLDINFSTYTLWCCNVSKNPYKPKIVGIRKTMRGDEQDLQINTYNTFR
jgi:hypothetical protein